MDRYQELSIIIVSLSILGFMYLAKNVYGVEAPPPFYVCDVEVVNKTLEISPDRNITRYSYKVIQCAGYRPGTRVDYLFDWDWGQIIEGDPLAIDLQINETYRIRGRGHGPFLMWGPGELELISREGELLEVAERLYGEEAERAIRRIAEWKITDDIFGVYVISSIFVSPVGIVLFFVVKKPKPTRKFFIPDWRKLMVFFTLYLVLFGIPFTTCKTYSEWLLPEAFCMLIRTNWPLIPLWELIFPHPVGVPDVSIAATLMLLLSNLVWLYILSCLIIFCWYKFVGRKVKAK